MYKLVLFDVGNILVKDSKDVSEYMSESIRNIYGRVVTVNLNDYSGWTSQEIAQDVLRKDKMDEAEIKAKLNRIMEDLFYTYYNVAGHDRQVLVDGARELLAQLWKKDITMGIITGEAERIAKFRAEKTTIHGFFKTGAYGNDGKTFEEIVRNAVKKAESEFKIGKEEILIVTNSPYMIKDAKAVGVASVGVESGHHSEGELRWAGASLVVKSIKDRGKIMELVG
jgi:phosphoglycolate phosphatase-like HAD superfamily hydrolase